MAKRPNIEPAPFRRAEEVEKLLKASAAIEQRLDAQRTMFIEANAEQLAANQRQARKRWVKALRSGYFKQGSDMLKYETNDGPELCALGVLAELVEPNGWGIVPLRMKPHNGDCHNISESVRAAAGLSVVDVQIIREMNDGGSDFNAIALWIENRFAGPETLMVDPMLFEGCPNGI